MQYFTTHPSMQAWPTAEGMMTIGIACICERGGCFVLASDVRATYGTMPHGRNYQPVGPNDQCGKVFRITPSLFGCVAGRLSECHAVISNTVARLRRLGTKRTRREDVASAVDMARVREMTKIYTWTLAKTWGISLHDFVLGKVPGGKLDPLLIRACYHLLKGTPLPVYLIIVGFVKGSGVFIRAVNKEGLQEETSPGVYAIGSGSVHAMRVLNRRGQNYTMSLPRTIFHMHEAVIAARKEKTVGPTYGYIVIRDRTTKVGFLPSTSPTLEGWMKAYKHLKTTASLDDSRVAAMQMYQQLKIMEFLKQ